MTVSEIPSLSASLARSENLRAKSIVWHAVDATRNLILPLIGLAWIVVDIINKRATLFDIAIFVIFLTATGIGMTVGLHRYFTHSAFSARPMLRYALAILGSMAWQRPLFKWVARHRLHHHYADESGDYHSPHNLYDGTPIDAPWMKAIHAHYAWLHIADPDEATVQMITSDLAKDPGLVWCDRHYNILASLSVVLPAFIGYFWYGTVEGAIRAAMWGGLGRIAVLLHLTWIINSACHLWGRATYETRGESHNIGFLGWVVFGEGYHNNHHAFPYSPHLGFDKGQVDIGWYFIRLCERFGLAYDLKPVPTDAQRNRRRRESG